MAEGLPPDGELFGYRPDKIVVTHDQSSTPELCPTLAARRPGCRYTEVDATKADALVAND